MTWFHLVQALVWGVGVALAFRQVRTLCFDAPLETRPLINRIETLLPEGRPQLRRLLEAGQPAWVAAVGLDALGATEGEARSDAAIDRLAELAQHAMRNLATLMTLGRIAPPLAFLGVILELTSAFAGGSGLEGLQKGLPEQLALGRAVTGVCLGAMTASFCFAAARVLAGRVRQLERDVTRVRTSIEDAAAC